MSLKDDIVKAGDPVLARATQAVDFALEPSLKGLVDRLKATLSQTNGVGISANQIAENERVCWVEVTSAAIDRIGHEVAKARSQEIVEGYALVNGTILEHSAEQEIWFEGCLSVPGYLAAVRRYRSLTVSGRNIFGEHVSLSVFGWHARILQHELDHLDGVLYTDRMMPRTLMTRENYNAQRRDLSVREILEGLSGGSSA